MRVYLEIVEITLFLMFIKSVIQTCCLYYTKNHLKNLIQFIFMLSLIIDFIIILFILNIIC